MTASKPGGLHYTRLETAQGQDLLVGAVRMVVIPLGVVRPGLQSQCERACALGLGRSVRSCRQLPGALPVAALYAESRQQRQHPRLPRVRIVCAAQQIQSLT